MINIIILETHIKRSLILSKHLLRINVFSIPEFQVQEILAKLNHESTEMLKSLLL